MKKLLISSCLLFSAINVTPLGAVGSGLDVQLKDLRGAFYYVETGEPKRLCAKLTAAQIKIFGRLTHCKPHETHVECHAKTGETLQVFEAEAECKKSLAGSPSTNR